MYDNQRAFRVLGPIKHEIVSVVNPAAQTNDPSDPIRAMFSLLVAPVITLRIYVEHSAHNSLHTFVVRLADMGSYAIRCDVLCNGI